MFKKWFLISLVIACFSLSAIAFAKNYSEDLIANHYEITMPDGDEGTLYLSSDGAMIFMPFITNNVYTHNCWADWKYVPKTQKLLIENAKHCQILNGAYTLEKISKGFEMRDKGKKFILRRFHKL